MGTTYRIGEVAELFGLTKEGIRYLEKEGIITARRNEANGYRYYDRNAVSMLKDVRVYQKLGFSLEEVRDCMLDSSPEDTLALMTDKSARMAEELQEAVLRQRDLEYRVGLLRRFMAEGVVCTLSTRPAMLFLPRLENDDRR